MWMVCHPFFTKRPKVNIIISSVVLYQMGNFFQLDMLLQNTFLEEKTVKSSSICDICDI